MARLNSVRIAKTKFGTYSLHFTNPDGRRRRLSIGKDRRYVELLARKFEDWLLQGKNPESEIERAKEKEKRKSITLRDLFEVFLKRHGSTRRTKTLRSYKNSFRNISRCPNLVNEELGLVTKGLALDYMNARKDEGVTSATVNREKALLSCMFSCAVEWEMIDHNPLQGLKSFKESEKRDVDVTNGQISELIDALPDSVACIVEFACCTGFRLENILSLRIEDIRFHDLTKTGEVYREVKGGRRILFPLGERAVEVLMRAIGERDEGYVFINPQSGTKYNSIQSSFNKAVKKTGLTALDGTKLRFHDLRHIFSNWLHMDGEGASLDQLRPLLGHKDRSTTDRYVTMNRRVVGKVLSLLPEIRSLKQKNSLNSEKAKAV